MIKASSIYESVISIAIISITVTVGTFIFVNIINSQHNISYYQMIEKVAELKTECYEKQQFTNKNIKFKNYQIEKLVTNYQKQKKLKLVKFIIKRDNKKVKIIQYLIKKK